MGTVLHHAGLWIDQHPFRRFQSPSRWGRCCIFAVFLRVFEKVRFSPLLDGDGVASARAVLIWPFRDQFQSPSDVVCVASQQGLHPQAVRTWCMVSVPFSMGTVFNDRPPDRAAIAGSSVSVPFSMGTVLHPVPEIMRRTDLTLFQSPSRWGRCCIVGIVALFDRGSRLPFNRRFSPLLDGGRLLHQVADQLELDTLGYRTVSVPFSMGTVLHRLTQATLPMEPEVFPQRSFSPLLDGDGVASSSMQGTFRHAASLTLASPLLDGDGVAKSNMRRGALRAFCSAGCVSVPSSRWGRCCIARVRRKRHAA